MSTEKISATSVVDGIFKEILKQKGEDKEKSSSECKKEHRSHRHHHKKHKKQKHHSKGEKHEKTLLAEQPEEENHQTEATRERSAETSSIDVADDSSIPYSNRGDTVSNDNDHAAGHREKLGQNNDNQQESFDVETHKKKDKKHKKHKHKDRKKNENRDQKGDDDKHHKHHRSKEKHKAEMSKDKRSKEKDSERNEETVHQSRERSKEKEHRNRGRELEESRRGGERDDERTGERDHRERSKEQEEARERHRKESRISIAHYTSKETDWETTTERACNHRMRDEEESKAGKDLHSTNESDVQCRIENVMEAEGAGDCVIQNNEGHLIKESGNVKSEAIHILDENDSCKDEECILVDVDSLESEEMRPEKHKSRDGDRKKSSHRVGKRSTGQIVQHLWEDEMGDEESSPECDFNCGESTECGETQHQTPSPEASSDLTNQSQWMVLPKDLDKDQNVNTSAWMRLPKDLEVYDNTQFDSDSDMPDFTEVVGALKKKTKTKLDFKIEIPKTLVTKPSSGTASLISSITDAIGSIRNQEKPVPSETTEPEHSVQHKDGSLQVVISNQPSVTEETVDTAGSMVPKKAGFGGLKLGIRISDTSAALIASGEKVENDPVNQNREEGEVTDSSAVSTVDAGSSCDPEGDTDSEIRISELSSSGSLSDSDQQLSDSESKSKSKKKKKKTKRLKHKKKKHKEAKKRRHSHSRSRSPKRKKRSRSRSKVRSFDEEKGVWRSRSRSRSGSRHRRRSRSRDGHRRSSEIRPRYRSRSRDRYERGRPPPYKRRSRSRSPIRKRTAADDLRLKIDKSKLRQIALRNAYANMQRGHGPKISLKPDEVAALKAGGKSVEELTDFCKKISEKETNLSSGDESDDSVKEHGSDEEVAPFINHPFKVKDVSNIVLNIRNAKQLPILSPAEKQVKSAELRLQFPVSSGTHHRAKEGVWVPVEKSKALVKLNDKDTLEKPVEAADSTAASSTTVAAITTSATAAQTAAQTAEAPKVLAIMPPPAIIPAAPVKSEDKVFPDPPSMPINIGELVSSRLSAMRKLQENPLDVQAMGKIFHTQDRMNQWAMSKQLPGHFTGTTGVSEKILSQSELKGLHQAWTKKDQLKTAAPVSGGIGKLLLQRLGWKEGEGLGKQKDGSKLPLLLDVKVDRKGLQSLGENSKKMPQMAVTTKDLSGKHPVSALVELCNRRKWEAPRFELVHESGPDHQKNFLFKVFVNGSEYQSTVASSNKKQAKAQAANVCLQTLGLVPR